MFDHIGTGVTDYAASKSFFLKSLEPLGVGIVMEGEHGLGIGPKGKPAFWLVQTTETPAPLHLAFAAENRQQVRDFHRAALEAGGKDNGAPGLRPNYQPNYYGAFVIGPDGHNVEAVCHRPEGCATVRQDHALGQLAVSHRHRNRCRQSRAAPPPSGLAPIRAPT